MYICFECWLAPMKIKRAIFFLVLVLIFLIYQYNINQSINLTIYQSIYLSINQSIYLSSNLSLFLSINLSIYLSINLSIFPSINQSIYLSIFPSINLSIYQSINISIYLSFYQSIYLSINLSIYLSFYPSINQSIYLSIFPFIYQGSSQATRSGGGAQRRPTGWARRGPSQTGRCAGSSSRRRRRGRRLTSGSATQSEVEQKSSLRIGGALLSRGCFARAISSFSRILLSIARLATSCCISTKQLLKKLILIQNKYSDTVSLLV